MNYKNCKTFHITLGVMALLIAMSAILFIMGREPICTCGYIKLWHGIVISSENSQHIFDWYTFTHIAHGLILYAIISFVRPKLSIGKKILIALAFESAWEILENTDMVINRYRAATISLDYYGDSMVNSLGDAAAMLAGFWFAAKQYIWLSILLFIIIEAALGIIIRDNLTLNIIMLINPLDAIKIWQSGQ